jgi:hypothetical protein
MMALAGLIVIAVALTATVVGLVARHRWTRDERRLFALNEEEVAEHGRPLVTHVEVLRDRGRNGEV